MYLFCPQNIDLVTISAEKSSRAKWPLGTDGDQIDVLRKNKNICGWFGYYMDLIDTYKRSRSLKIGFYASTRVPTKGGDV